MPTPAARKFLAKHNPLPAYRKYSAKDAKRLEKRIPKAMRDILKQVGWCAFDGGAIWLCDPAEWETIGRPWLPDDATACDVLLRSSFGDLIVWDGRMFWLILPQLLTRIRQTSDPDWLFGETLQQSGFDFNDTLPTAHAAAHDKVGNLKPDEIYSYAPALPLGGNAETSEISKEDAAVALAILQQLGPIRSFDK